MWLLSKIIKEDEFKQHTKEETSEVTLKKILLEYKSFFYSEVAKYLARLMSWVTLWKSEFDYGP